jgi:nucleotide-binding universal stress UspA family protein
MTGSILITLDGSPLAERAVPYAAALARATERRLVLLRVAVAHDGGGRGQPPEAIRADLERVAEPVRSQGLAVEVAVDSVDDPAEVVEAICAGARERQADVLVMSTHRRGGLGRWLYGSVADAVLRHADLPVLLVPAACERVWSFDRPLRVVVPLDGSPLAEEVVPAVAALVGPLHPELVLLQVVEPPSTAMASAAMAPAYVYFDPQEWLPEARQYLEGVASRLRAAGQAARVEARVGPPAETIVQLARESQAQFVALATHGRGGLARLVLGSVATRTLHQATVPLLLVRPAALGEGASAA